MRNLIFVFFFFSGFTSLVFEVVWERELAQVFGTTSLALATLLTAFMSGLALGSRIGGRYADRLKSPLVVYGLLEGAIGLYAFAIPFLLDLLPSLYRVIFDAFLEDFIIFSLLRFLAVFVILVVPTTMMGATLPILSEWIAKRSRQHQGRIGLLYAVNTLGACTGCLLAGFVVLPNLGLSTTNVIFAISNLILCVVVVAFARFAPAEGLEELEEIDELDEDDYALFSLPAVPLGDVTRKVLIASFAAAGAVSMGYQVLWTRAYVIVLGSSTYSFTLILTTFLLGLAAGSAVISAKVQRIRRPALFFAGTQAAIATFAVLSFWLLDRLPEFLFERLRQEIGAPSEIFAYQFFLVGIVVFIPIFLQGMAFPLVVRAIVGERHKSGEMVGKLYAFNTVGAILGAFIAGFVLMPSVGLHRAIALTIGLNLVVAIAVGFAAGREEAARRPKFVVGGLVIVALAAFVFAPTIDRVRLTRGMFRVYWARELFDPEKLAKDDPELVFYADGLTATTSVEKRGDLVTLKANGKPEASDGADMSTQILVALAPFLLRSMDPDNAIGGEEVAMVGFGSGVTAGAALQWPLERLDVVEIEETMIDASHFFDHVNHRPLEDPRTVVYTSDGRNFLEYNDALYDVIVSEPSNPWIAGVASLFTVEHFRRARTHLARDGTFAQWVQLYEISPENVRVIFATFLEVFPDAVAFSSMPKGTDLILVGSREPFDFPVGGFERAWEVESVREELHRAGIARKSDFYGLMFMNNEELRAFANGAPLNTDDNGLLEFAAPKDLIRYNVGESFFQEHYFGDTAYGDIRPLMSAYPDGLTKDEAAELAIAEWVAGKVDLAEAILDDFGMKGPPDPFGEQDAAWEVRAALEAHRIDRLEAVRRAWPNPGSSSHTITVDALTNAKALPAMLVLEEDGQPPRGGFDGEKGLAYAYVLTELRYYRHALEQVDGLIEREDPVVETLPFELLEGFISAKRRRYERSYQSYISAGRLLAEHTRRSPEVTPPRPLREDDAQ